MLACLTGQPPMALAQNQQIVASRPCQHLLAVTWRVTHVRGRVRTVAIERIVDPSAGATPEEAAANPVRMELPPAYLAAARAYLSAPTYEATSQSPFWTFTLYDPAQPNRADISSARDCLLPPPVG